MAATFTTLPSPDVFSKAASLNVFDESGKEVSFGSLFQDQKTIVVFIRVYPFQRF